MSASVNFSKLFKLVPDTNLKLTKTKKGYTPPQIVFVIILHKRRPVSAYRIKIGLLLPYNNTKFIRGSVSLDFAVILFWS